MCCLSVTRDGGALAGREPALPRLLRPGAPGRDFLLLAVILHRQGGTVDRPEDHTLPKWSPKRKVHSRHPAITAEAGTQLARAPLRPLHLTHDNRRLRLLRRHRELAEQNPSSGHGNTITIT